MKWLPFLAEVKYNPSTKQFDFGGGFASGGPGAVFATVADTLILLIGSISVIMVIIGGIRYTLSGGNPQATKGAKDTILYALIGVVVSVLAYAAVVFIKNQF